MNLSPGRQGEWGVRRGFGGDIWRKQAFLGPWKINVECFYKN